MTDSFFIKDLRKLLKNQKLLLRKAALVKIAKISRNVISKKIIKLIQDSVKNSVG